MYLSPGLFGFGDPFHSAFGVAYRDHGADLRLGVGGVAADIFLRDLDQPLEECIKYGAVHVDALQGNAHLPCVVKCRVRASGDGLFNIVILADDGGGIGAKLQRTAPKADGFLDLFAHRHAAREAVEADIRVLREVIADILALP